MITAGIDCGAKNTKAIILKDGQIIGKGKVLTGFDQNKAINASLVEAYKNAGIANSDVEKFGGTGSGSKAIKESVIVNDIKAVAKGAHYFFPNARTVTDVGAEESRAVKIDANGNVVDFAINEKCAAGAGAFLETMSRALETPIEEMGPLALTSKAEIAMNAQCVIFAESEVVGLIHAKIDRKDISKAIHDAMASRIVSMIHRIGVNEEIVMVGGVGYNPGFIKAMKSQLNIDDIRVPHNPDLAAAVGAALLVENI